MNLSSPTDNLTKTGACAQDPSVAVQLLTVKNAGCMSCVGKIESALNAVDGVKSAVMDFPSRTVKVLGHADPARLILAAEKTGYELTAEATTLCPQAGPAKTQDSVSSDSDRSPQIPASTALNSQFFIIDGASCGSCVAKIETALKKVDGVVSASMNLAEGSVTVLGEAAEKDLIAAIDKAGYAATSKQDATEDTLAQEKQQADANEYRRLMRSVIIALGLGIPLMLYGMFIGDMSINNNTQRGVWLIIGLATFGVMFFAGKHFYANAWKSFKNHHATMDTLVAMGTGAAWLYSMMVVLLPSALPDMARHVYFEATAMIIGLINLGLAFELKAKGRTSLAIKRLIGLRASTARVIRNGKEMDIALEEVLIGELIRLRPGEKIPVDGVVTEGQSFIDESMLTGEPMPAARTVGSEVFSGTINKAGSLVLRATRVGKDTALAKIIAMVKNAQNSKPAIGRLADAISAYFVPAVMIIAVITALAWLNFGSAASAPAFAIICATTVLVIACPCALGLATPMSVMVGVGKAAEVGVLIRNGEALQTASEITTMVLDKTGTITQGKPEVTSIHITKNSAKEDILQLAASLEAGSEHPLAQAITESAKSQGQDLLPFEHFDAVAGYGVTGVVTANALVIGNAKLMEDHHISIEAYMEIAQSMASNALTPVYVAINSQLEAIIGISDPLKPDSIQAIKRLQDNGIRVLMLTGDNRATAQAVANKAGLREYSAEVLPADKAKKIGQLQNEGEIVGMTGDGVNDAPALALADVGFAIGTGTDIAIESADVTLIRGSLHGLADAIAVSKATLRNIKQNLFGAFIYNVAGVPIAAGVLYPAFGILLSPVIAGAAMAFSSVTVVSNANRLRFFQPQAQ